MKKEKIWLAFCRDCGISVDFKVTEDEFGNLFLTFQKDVRFEKGDRITIETPFSKNSAANEWVRELCDLLEKVTWKEKGAYTRVYEFVNKLLSPHPKKEEVG